MCFGSRLAQACTDDYASNLEYRDEQAAVFTYNSTRQRTVTFDIASVLKRKICEARMAHFDHPFGIAVFDVEYDAEALPCESFNHTGGSFSRLEAIKAMLHFAKETRYDSLVRHYRKADGYCARAALGSYYVPESPKEQLG